MEVLDIVDGRGAPTGRTVERETAHRLGIRHRTSHVWLVRKRCGRLQVLLQKRSAEKDSHPGCYDISSAGHIPAGEGFLESALRELREELGVRAVGEELRCCGQRRFESRETFPGGEFWDNQVSNVYVLCRDLEAEDFTLQESEVEGVLWMDLNRCMDLVQTQEIPNCIQMEELRMVVSAVGGS